MGAVVVSTCLSRREKKEKTIVESLSQFRFLIDRKIHCVHKSTSSSVPFSLACFTEDIPPLIWNFGRYGQGPAVARVGEGFLHMEQRGACAGYLYSGSVERAASHPKKRRGRV